MENYCIKEVTTSADKKAWLYADRDIYKDYPNWVCPLDCDIENVFDKSKNEFFESGEAIRWLAYECGSNKIVGRIAAFYSKVLSTCNEKTGGCGFFESINNQDVANMLFDTAKSWLSGKGLEAMEGPINFGSRDAWWGLLVQGFDYQPLYNNPYNPPYYKELFENYGFQNYFNQNSYLWQVGKSTLSDMVLAKAERIVASGEYSYKDIRNTKLEVATENLRQIYNKAWALFEGVKPMTKEEAQIMVNTLKPIIDPNIIYFAYHGEEPIGFFVMVPDINRIIHKFRGKFGIINKLRLLWTLHRRKCDRIFGIIFAITPEYQGKGIESGMFKYILENYIQTNKCCYKDIEFAWIGDFNPVMNRMLQQYVCAKQHKMHTTYLYLFDRTAEFHRCPRLGLRPRKRE